MTTRSVSEVNPAAPSPPPPRREAERRSPRFLRWRRATFWTLFVGYVAYYLCRANLDAVMPLIGRDLGLSDMALGSVVTVSTWFYAAGKFTHGFLADIVGGRVLFLVGLLGAALFSALFGLFGGMTAFIVIWSANRFLQAGGWVGMVQVTAQWYPTWRVGGVMAVLSLSFSAGDIVARNLSALVVDAGFGWRGAFFVPAVITLVFAGVAWFTLKSAPETVGEPPLDAAEAGPPREAGLTGDVIKRLLTNGPFWMLAILSISLTGLRLAFLTWTTSYLLSLGDDAGAALAKSSLFPAAGIAGTLFAGFYSDYVSKGRRGPISVLLLAALTVALFLLGGPLGADPTTALVLVGVVGFTLMGPYSLIAGAGAIDFGGRQAAAAAAGLLDGIGYLFSAVLGGVGMAALATELGWDGAFRILAWLSAATLVPALLITRWQRRPPGAD